MFGKKPSEADVVMDKAMLRILEDMEMFGPGTEKYQELLNQLDQFTKLRAPAKQKLSRDNLILVAGNLLGIVLIVAYEQKNVLTSKAQAFVLKPK